MTNIEKIRQETERRKKICECIFERDSDTYYQGKAVAYGELLPFIDSLPEEKPSDDLEEAARLYAIPHYMRDVDVNYLEEYPYDKIAEAAFIAGAKWQMEQFTWEDIANIDVYMSDVECEFRKAGRRLGDDTFYKEVFKRFKEGKND